MFLRFRTRTSGHQQNSKHTENQTTTTSCIAQLGVVVFLIYFAAIIFSSRMNRIAENIRNIREAKKISQYAIAYAMEISQAAYSKIERGETEIKATHLYLIAGALKISVYDLLPPTLAGSTFDGADYLIKPFITRLKQVWFTFLAQKRLKKISKTEPAA